MGGLKNAKAGLWFLALAAFLKELVFASLVPLWQGPDEPVHFSYLQFIAEEKEVPVYHLPFETYKTDLSPELAQSVSAMDKDFVSFHPDNIQRFLYGEGGTWPSPPLERTVAPDTYRNAALGYSPLYYLHGAVFYGLAYRLPVDERAFAVRAGTALLIVPFVLFCFGYGRLLLGNKTAALALAAFAAFQPQLSFVFAIVNNDAMLITCSAGAAYFLALWLARGGLIPALWTGLFVALAGLAKPQGLFLVPVWFAVAGMRLYFHRSTGWKDSVGSLAVMVTVALPWFIFCTARYGHPLGPAFLSLAETATKYPPHSLVSTFTPLFFRWPYTMFVSFWGNFGHLDAPLPPALTSILWVFYIVALVSASVVVVMFAVKRRFFRRARLFAVSVVSVFLLDLLLALSFYNSIMYEGGQGRYYFPAWLFMAGAVFFAAGMFFRGPWRSAVYLALAGGMVFLCLFAAYGVIMPRYYL